MNNLNEYSVPQLIRTFGERFRDYRLTANLTQKEVAEKCNVTVATIHKFENGLSGNVSMGTFLLLLKSVGMLDRMDFVLPEMEESPYLVKGEKKVQRIRHTKQ